MPEPRRAGRWRTGQQSKQRILAAARANFMRDGYEKATVRTIASEAGVDVAMVYYFFGNKEALFSVSVLTGPEHPLHLLATLLDEGPDDIGARLARRFLEHWDQGGLFEPLLTLFRSASIHPEARTVLHDAMAGPMARRVAAEFGVSDAELRVELVATHLMGVAFARYQLKIEPMASAPVDKLVESLGPTLHRYLTASGQ
jgi:AcrR family transcriptional regulator